MAKYIRTLTVYYNTKISHKEISLFRGAVIKSLGDKVNLLYHNHMGDDKYRYSYPLIQYKCLNGNAAITCVEEGVNMIGQFLSNASETMMLGEREAKYDVERVQPSKTLVQIWKKPFSYHLHRWLPLNPKNYHLYQTNELPDERKKLLSNILKGNLLSMLKGLGIFLEEELYVEITQLSDSYIIYNKGIALMAFNADFKCNLSIPNNLGIGKNASVGCGIIREKKTDREKPQEDGNV
jgi:hypothetical protein